jgi:four helix bundle protein
MRHFEVFLEGKDRGKEQKNRGADEQGTDEVRSRLQQNGCCFRSESANLKNKITAKMEKKYNLRERLIQFACRVIAVTEALPRTVAGHHFGNQLVRSGTSPALHYGEAQAAESTADFVHKMKVCLKELRETYNCLQIIEQKKWFPNEKMTPVLDENNQLISIFFTSIETARHNHQKEKQKPS